MKNKILIVLMGTLVLTSCKKFLEQVPDQRTELDSPEKVSELLVSAYPKANFTLVAESMSDNVGDNAGGTPNGINSDAYSWTDNDETGQDATTYFWNACYRAIASANQALEAIEIAPNKQAYRSQKGEALLCRAYAHFMLVSLYAKSYDPVTAASDPGVPFVTEPETVVFKNYTRSTVDSVYKQIEKDITDGLPLLDDNRYAVPRYHFNKVAAQAFATRFYLFKRDYEKAVEHATKAFPAGNFLPNMRPWLTTYAGMTSTEVGLAYVKTSENANLLIGETTSWWARRFTSQRFSTTGPIIEKIMARAGNTHVTGGQTAYNYFLNTTSQIYYIRKTSEHFVRTSLNATTGVGWVMQPLFTTEEVLLNRAEAYASMGNYTAALKDLNLFFSARIKSYSSTSHAVTEEKAKTFYKTTDTKEAIIMAILDAKRAEFIHEGLRWFDILRHKLPVVHKTNDGKQYELKADDPRKVWQIPVEAAAMLGANPR